MDRSEDDGELEAEYVHELKNKRFGLSETVHQQVRRYSDAVKRGQMIPFAEVSGLGTLIGRRPDAEKLFRHAGASIARELYDQIPRFPRVCMKWLPAFIARPMALRRVRSIMRRYFDGPVRRTGSFLALDVQNSITANSAPRSIGCTYYESALRELLRLLVDGAGAVEHVRCIQRGDLVCEWRADWRVVRQ